MPVTPRRAVLVTRPEPGASQTAMQLLTAGYRPIQAPFLMVEPCRVSLPLPAKLQAVVVASGNAVHLPTGYHPVPLLAVGDSTAARARAAGFIHVVSAGGDAGDLLALAGRTLLPERGAVLLATGRGQGTRLARLLRAGGLQVHRRAVYAAAGLRTFPTGAAEAITGELHAALFFSAATARSFVRLLPARLQLNLRNTAALAIGPTVAATLSSLPWRDIRVAAKPTQEGILALL